MEGYQFGSQRFKLLCIIILPLSLNLENTYNFNDIVFDLRFLFKFLWKILIVVFLLPFSSAYRVT